MIKHHLIVALCLLFLQSFSPAHAIEPGTLTPRKPDYQLPLIPQWQKDKTNPKDLDIKAPKEKTLQQTDGVQFILKAIQFDGNKSLSKEALQAVIQPFINNATSRMDLEQIRQQLIQHYRQTGYLYPSVILPSQHISQGLVRYQINEGHLTEINIKGAGRLDNDYISNRIKVNLNQPLKQSTLLEHFQLLLTDPLIERVNGALNRPIG